MRSREAIEAEAPTEIDLGLRNDRRMSRLVLEVLLDIRELLITAARKGRR